jgi:hypothetical protein
VTFNEQVFVAKRYSKPDTCTFIVYIIFFNTTIIALQVIAGKPFYAPSYHRVTDFASNMPSFYIISVHVES